MEFITAIHTDVGIKKKTNQDSVLVMEADTELGKVLLAVVCDGMGGLAKGEVASATVIRAYAKWFEEELPHELYNGISEQTLRKSMENVVYSMNNRISSYGRSAGINLGTTVVALVIVNNIYYCLNIGDSRCYHITNREFIQITRDQTFIQREMDMGRITPEEAKTHPQRNVLLQCVGASEYIVPDFYVGQVNADELFMMCSDGYRHLITTDEFFQYLNPTSLQNEEQMKESIQYFTELNKYRHEEDNISVILIRTN